MTGFVPHARTPLSVLQSQVHTSQGPPERASLGLRPRRGQCNLCLQTCVCRGQANNESTIPRRRGGRTCAEGRFYSKVVSCRRSSNSREKPCSVHGRKAVKQNLIGGVPVHDPLPDLFAAANPLARSGTDSLGLIVSNLLDARPCQHRSYPSHQSSLFPPVAIFGKTPHPIWRRPSLSSSCAGCMISISIFLHCY